MAKHIHKKFTTDQVKELLQKYIDKEVERKYLQEILGIGRSRFFELLEDFRDNPQGFSVEYNRSSETKRIDPAIQENILKELAIDKKAIQNKDIPLYKYNYSYVRKWLKDTYGQSAALSTIIEYAKANNFYLPKRKKPKAHDREVLTTYPGELIQHDASYHLSGPLTRAKNGA